MRATLIAAKEEPFPAEPSSPISEPKVAPARKPPPQPPKTLRPAAKPPPIIRKAETAQAALPQSPLTEDSAATTPGADAPSGTDLPAPIEEPVAASDFQATPLRVARPMPSQGMIRYHLFYGANRFMVGRSELAWDIEDGRYRLSTKGETVGLAALFYPFGMSSESAGRISATGFEPDFFRIDRTSRRGEKQLRVTFDRPAGVLRLSGPEGASEVPLRPSSLDLLSLICQLSVIRLEPGPMQFNLTNGRKLDTYAVEVGAHEVVDTPMGDLRTLYVKQVRKPGDEGIEVWLAVDFGYLPVRLRFTDRKGSIAGEQLVTAIQLVRG